MTPFLGRCLDVDVVVDLMIHDLDLVLSLAGSEVKNIRASGIKVLSECVDIANARIEFDSGTVARLMACRTSAGSSRKMMIFRDMDCFVIDFDAYQGDALMEEIKSFAECVKTGACPLVDGEAGRDALMVAEEIRRQIG
jgi:predicted dehydrogenase